MFGDQEIILDDLSKKELLDLHVECMRDSKLLAKVLFPEEFFKPFSKAHDEIFDLIDHSKAKKKCIAAPRGIGKSSIANLVCKGDILGGRKHFIGYLSDSLTKAEMETENIKSSLMTNEMIRKLFPPINAKYHDSSDDSFSKKSWVAYGRTFVLPRGAGQQVNGLRWLHHRPDRWIIDDFENVKEVESEIQRSKNREWFYGALMNTVSRYEKNYEFLYIDTIKHQDALIVELLNDPDWESIQLSVCSDDYKTLMPDFITQEELDREVESHRLKHILDLFAMNFMSQPTSQEDNSFKDLFQYYSETDADFISRTANLINIVIVDPAKTKKMHNAQSGVVVWGVDLDRRKYYVRTAIGEFYHPDELVNRALSLADQYNADAIGMELTGLEEWGSYNFKNMMIGRGGRMYHFEELKARGGRGELGGIDGSKAARVTHGILPLYRQGLVYHNRVGVGALESQMLSFPRPKRWDVLDAAAYLPKMLEKALMYLSPEKWDSAVESAELIEEEYNEIVNEPKFEFSGVGYDKI